MREVLEDEELCADLAASLQLPLANFQFAPFFDHKNDIKMAKCSKTADGNGDVLY